MIKTNENGSAFADGDDVVFLAVKRHQFAKTPNAGEIELALVLGPLGRPASFEKIQLLRDRELRPFIADVEKAAAFRARDLHVIDRVGRATRWRNAFLKRGVVHWG